MTLPVVRPIEPKDLPAFLQFAKEAQFGITTLPREKKILEEKIAASIESFKKEQNEPKNETYLFVLETPNKEVVGVSGIISRIGAEEPFYAYHVLHTHRVCEPLNIDRQVPLLHFTKARKKPTEIGTLFLKPAHRKKGLGHLLSFCRFLFMAEFKARFASIVIAEMRGVSDEKGVSPFYNAIGKHFLEVSFDEANHLRLTHPKSIMEVFPEYPIYPELLPKEAYEVIGLPHKETLPAVKLLEKQGFKRSHYVDIFDAGPHLFSPIQEIQAVNKSVVVSTYNVVPTLPPKTPSAFVATTSLRFRATLAPLLVTKEGEVTIEKQTLQLLGLSHKEPFRSLFL